MASNSCGAPARLTPKTGREAQGYTPPPEAIRACESIMETADIDVGGIEHDPLDRGSLVYYDINALSNFVADAANVVGFDGWIICKVRRK